MQLIIINSPQSDLPVYTLVEYKKAPINLELHLEYPSLRHSRRLGNSIM